MSELHNSQTLQLTPSGSKKNKNDFLFDTIQTRNISPEDHIRIAKISRQHESFDDFRLRIANSKVPKEQMSFQF